MGESDEMTPVECLSPRSRELVEKAQATLELHISPHKVESAKHILRMQTHTEARPMAYRLIKALFHATVDIFYHYTEVVGQENIPPPGNGAILCPNHGNSLTDAVVCVSQTPRMVRLTAKDTLFNIPFFGPFVRGVGTVPLQREDEHKEGVDNKSAVTTLNEELLSGQLVCLFPEGRSRFHWKVDEIKYGVAAVAYNTLVIAKDRGQDDYKLSICPSAFNYLNREKFRSGLVVEFGPPIVLTPKDDVMSLPKREAVQKLSERVQSLMSLSAYHAEDWNTLKIAHTARNIFAPLGTAMTIVEFVNRTKYWASAIGAVDPADPTLLEDLSAYQDAIEKVGLKDRRVHRLPGSAVWIVWSLLVRMVQIVLLAVLVVAGVVLWSPIFFISKKHEGSVMKRTKKPTHVDEVAQYKMMTGVVLLPPICLVGSVLLVCYLGYAWWTLVVALPLVALYMWVSIRLIEDLISALRSFRSLYILLVLPAKKHEELREYVVI